MRVDDVSIAAIHAAARTDGTARASTAGPGRGSRLTTTGCCWSRGRTRCRLLVSASVVSLLLSACDYGLATQGGLVVNLTDQDLVVEVIGTAEPHRGEVPADGSGRWDAYDGCLGTAIAVSTPAGEKLTTLDRRICDGERLTIRPDDLLSEHP